MTTFNDIYTPAVTLGGTFTMSGAFNFTGTLTNTTSVTFPTSGTLATTSQIPTGAALTSGNDTNVTLTLGGSPTTALVNASSITAGWSGQLSLARGGTNASLTASNGGIFYSTASAGAILAGTATANQVLLSGASTTPAWSTATYPATTTINQILYSSSANTIAGLATANNGVLLTSGSGVPSIGTATVPVGGTGNTTFTAYSVICAGTTATGIFQNVSGVGTAGQVLTSAGASALPTWSNPSDGVVINQNSSSVTLAAGARYYINNGASLVTLTLPTTAAQGDRFQIMGGSSGGWKIAQNASQTINFDNTPTTAGTGGSLASTNQYDCITVDCITTNTTFVVSNSIGSITVV